MYLPKSTSNLVVHLPKLLFTFHRYLSHRNDSKFTYFPGMFECYSNPITIQCKSKYPFSGMVRDFQPTSPTSYLKFSDILLSAVCFQKQSKE